MIKYAIFTLIIGIVLGLGIYIYAWNIMTMILIILPLVVLIEYIAYIKTRGAKIRFFTRVLGIALTLSLLGFSYIITLFIFECQFMIGNNLKCGIYGYIDDGLNAGLLFIIIFIFYIFFKYFLQKVLK